MILKEKILNYYWKTCYPNADRKEFEENWLKGENADFIDGLMDIITDYYKVTMEKGFNPMNWINVKDKMPIDSIFVLVHFLICLGLVYHLQRVA